MARARAVLGWYFAASLLMLVAAVIVSSSFVTPLHATFAHPVLILLARVALWSAVAAVAIFLISLGLNAVHIMVGRGARWVGGMAGSTALLALSLALGVDSVNVLLDRSAPLRATAAVVEPAAATVIEPGATVRLADWRQGGGEPMRVKFEPRIFRIEAGGKAATFDTRQGRFEIPYAVALR